MNHISLFSGIGGFDLAADWMGWTNVAHCEWNPFGQKVLNYYWPNAISYHDITKTDFTVHAGTIDILTGGFPCQPYSNAGKRKGKADERHLWPEMLRAIREIRPRWIVGENVRGLTNWNGGLVFDEVQSDLENEGYEVTPFLLPACAVDAPHRRDRIWFIAYANHLRSNQSDKPAKQSRETEIGTTGAGLIPDNVTDTDSGRLERPIKKRRNGNNVKRQSNTGITSNPNPKRLQRKGQPTGVERKRPSKPSTQITRPTWENFPTQSPICNGNDGISARLDPTAVFEGIPKAKKPVAFPRWRNESIKAGGNAIVPQVVFEIFKAIQQYETR